jgi:hypothetical protein
VVVRAAFQPDERSLSHPIFPKGVGDLTMFADYRVPAFLHSFGAIRYAPSQLEKLLSGDDIRNGSVEEISLRAGGVLAVEKIKAKLNSIKLREGGKLLNGDSPSVSDPESDELIWTSVDVDFWLWDTAKRYEALDHRDVAPKQVVHRTRSIWY